MISPCGTIHPTDSGNFSSAIGQMKISPDGKWLANVFENSTVTLSELFSFDNATGIVSNPISLPVNGREYGAAFSPDNSKLYISTAGHHKVYQYDLSAGNIIASKTLIVNRPNWGTLGMQLGPDGKIYVCTGAFGIDVIDKPNLSGVNCNYILDAIVLPNLCFWSLPGMIDSFRYTNRSLANECDIDIEVDSLPLIEMPNVFTPNNDGKNDLFLPKTYREIISFHVKIFNRWGEIVFESDNATIGWSGKSGNGKLCPNGVYYYILNYSDKLTPKGTLKGWVELLN